MYINMKRVLLPFMLVTAQDQGHGQTVPVREIRGSVNGLGEPQQLVTLAKTCSFSKHKRYVITLDKTFTVS
jgi:hypothetical protein